MYRMAWGIRGGSSEGQLMYRVGLGEGAVRDS